MDAQREEALELLRIEKLKKESQVIQRGLPKPSKINEQSFKPISSKSDIGKVNQKCLERDFSSKLYYSIQTIFFSTFIKLF